MCALYVLIARITHTIFFHLIHTFIFSVISSFVSYCLLSVYSKCVVCMINTIYTLEYMYINAIQPYMWSPLHFNFWRRYDPCDPFRFRSWSLELMDHNSKSFFQSFSLKFALKLDACSQRECHLIVYSSEIYQKKKK